MNDQSQRLILKNCIEEKKYITVYENCKFCSLSFLNPVRTQVIIMICIQIVESESFFNSFHLEANNNYRVRVVSDLFLRMNQKLLNLENSW